MPEKAIAQRVLAMIDESDIPIAPLTRPDLDYTWKLIAKLEKNSNRNYRAAARNIRLYVSGFDYIDFAELAKIHQYIDTELKRLEDKQNTLLLAGLTAAVAAVRLVFPEKSINKQLEESVLQYLVNMPAKDGLNLSSRLWRIHSGAGRDLKAIIDIAVQRGWDAVKATQHVTEISGELREALKNAGSSQIAKRLEDRLLVSSNNARTKFNRVLRTEINRAHGEQYKETLRQDPNIYGLKFMLSPRHPRFDICDEHAEADLFGLGPGVYPIDNCPWPAHPNTFSYVEGVFIK